MRLGSPPTAAPVRADPGGPARDSIHVAVAPGLGLGELERARGLEGPAPHLDTLGEKTRDDRNGMEAEMPTDGWVGQPGALEDRGRAEGARGEDHGPCAHDEPP